MANDNHLFSVPCYNGTMLKQDYYNDFFEIGQQKINFSFFELGLPDDDPVYTLKNVMEDYAKFSFWLISISNKTSIFSLIIFSQSHHTLFSFNLIHYSVLQAISLVPLYLEELSDQFAVFTLFQPILKNQSVLHFLLHP